MLGVKLSANHFLSQTTLAPLRKEQHNLPAVCVGADFEGSKAIAAIHQLVPENRSPHSVPTGSSTRTFSSLPSEHTGQTGCGVSRSGRRRSMQFIYEHGPKAKGNGNRPEKHHAEGEVQSNMTTIEQHHPPCVAQTLISFRHPPGKNRPTQSLSGKKMVPLPEAFR